MIVMAVTLLPQPDSPTTPSVSPLRSEKSTPSTAFTRPSITWKWVRRLRTSSRTSLCGAAAAGPSARACGSVIVSVVMIPLLATARVERVAESVADEVDGDDGQGDRHPGE